MSELVALFAEELDVDPSSLDEDSSPDTVEQWDSLASMRLVAAIEETFKIQLTTGEIMKMRSIALARKVLQAKGVNV